MRPPADTQPPMTPADVEDGLENPARSLAIGPFGLLLVGDGSGTACSQPAGWSCVTYGQIKSSVVPHGGADTGVAENLAGPGPHARSPWSRHQVHPPDGPFRVHVVGDGGPTVRRGNGTFARLRRHHVDRNTSPGEPSRR